MGEELSADQAVGLLGKFSRWHMQTCLPTGFAFGIVFSWSLMSLMFIADTPPHRCRLPSNSALNESIPQEYRHGKRTWSQCQMYVDSTISNNTQACTDGYWYDPEAGYESTVVTEFDLVCDKDGLVEMSMMLKGIGQAVGAPLLSPVSDLYGRKPTFLVCVWAKVIIGIILAFSPNFAFYATFLFFEGILIQGMANSSLVLTIEHFSKKRRTFANVFLETAWGIGMMLLTPLVYLLRNWRHLQMTLSIPLSLTIIFYWFVNESVPWLLANGKVQQAEDIIRKAGKINKVTLPEVVFIKEAEDHSNVDSEDVRCFGKLFRKRKRISSESIKNRLRVFITSPSIRLYTTVIILLWFVNCFVYMGLSMTVTSLVGNRYLNFFFYALVEIPAFQICGYFMLRFGRVRPLCGFHFLCGTVLLATAVQTLDLGPARVPLTVFLSVVGKFAVSASFMAIAAITPEMYPTNIRNMGLGSGQFAARVATFIAPFARMLVRHSYWMPAIIFGIASILAGILALILPETRWRPLPETVQEVEQWRHQPKFYKPKQDDKCFTMPINDGQAQYLSETRS